MRRIPDEDKTAGHYGTLADLVVIINAATQSTR